MPDENEFIDEIEKENANRVITPEMQYKIAKGYQKIMNYQKSNEFYKKCEM